MNPKSDDDLLKTFAHARRCDRDEAPAWRPELLEARQQRPGFARRWVLVTASMVALAAAVFLMQMPKHETPLSEALPPLLDSAPGELFASVEPPLMTFEAPSDFLLTPHLTPSIP